MADLKTFPIEVMPDKEMYSDLADAFMQSDLFKQGRQCISQSFYQSFSEFSLLWHPDVGVYAMQNGPNIRPTAQCLQSMSTSH